jgi:lysophospholipase L1-like esterase
MKGEIQMKRRALFILLLILGPAILGLALGLLDPKNSMPKSVQAQSPQVKIMPLGDSITLGAGSSGKDCSGKVSYDGYRWYLHQFLTAEGYNIDFVGSEPDGRCDFDDQEHEGHPGSSAAGIAAKVYNWLVKNPADIVLLHIGIVDVIGPQNVPGIVGDIEEILKQIDQYEKDHNTDVIVILARITNIDPSKHGDPLEAEMWKDKISKLNVSLQQRANDRIAHGDKIIVVNMEEALDSQPDMFSDKIHPNDTGYEVMARVWLPAVKVAILQPMVSRISVTTNVPEISLGDGFCSLIEAINEAQAPGMSSISGDCEIGRFGPDTILLQAPGSFYRLTAVDNTTDGPNGLPSITSEITIRNNHAFASRSFIVRSAAPGTPDLRIFHVAATGNLTLEEVLIENGHGDNGGGILNRGTVTLDDSQVIGNEANNGGGIYNNKGTVTLTNSHILGNEAIIDGGGIFNDGGTVNLANNSIISNNNADVSGGGIKNDNGGMVDLTDSTIRENTAGNDGGGIDNYRQGTVRLTNSLVSGNSAGHDGGGIDNYNSPVELLNSTISGNTCGNYGGGIDNYNGTSRILFSTIANNNADLGGGIFNGPNGTVELGGTILAKNHEGGNCLGSITPLGGYNLIEKIGDCDYTPTTGDLVGTENNPIDPIISYLQDNGGPTFTHGLMRTTDPAAPSQDSPAIDAMPAGPLCPSTDQRGAPRPADGNEDGTAACDIGAFERQEGETAIELISFTAQAGVDNVTLAWETGTEMDNAGFNIWRSEAAQGPYTKLNDALIPAEGDPVFGASYVYIDSDGVKRVTYYYKLEDVDIHGVTTLHGPVSAKVRPRFRRPPYRPTLPGF